MNHPFALLTLLTLGACESDTSTGDTTESPDTGSETGDTNPGDGTDGGEDTSDEEEVENNASVSGVVLLSDGSPLLDARINLCHDVCRTTSPDETGAFLFEGVEVTNHAFDVVVTSDGHWTTPLFPLDLGDSEARDVGNLIVPAFDEIHPVSDAEAIALDGGLTVDIDPSAYEAPVFTTEDPFVAAKAIGDVSTLPVDGVDGTIIAGWYMGEFDALVDPGWAFQVDADLGLSEGDTVTVLIADYWHADWEDAGTATVNAEGVLVSDEGTGITILSTLLLVQ